MLLLIVISVGTHVRGLVKLPLIPVTPPRAFLYSNPVSMESAQLKHGDYQVLHEAPVYPLVRS